MPSCPNCGRQTLRTKDWACQWCGYPLISRAYKKIDKTFKELQEERSLPTRYEEAETDTIPEPELEAETQPEPQPEPPPETPRHRFFHREPKPEPKPAPEEETSTPPVMRQEPPAAKPQPETKTEPAPRPSPQSPPPATGTESQVKLEPETELPPGPEPEPVPQLPPQPVAMPEPEPEPPPVPVIPLDSIKEGMEITVDQLNALFKAEKSNAHARFKDKVVIVRGTVEKVFIREHLEIRYIVLAGSHKKELWSVRCSFEKEGAAGLDRLDEGQEAMVRGKYDGYGKNIIFKNCTLA